MKHFRGVSIFILAAVAICFIGVAVSRNTTAEDTTHLSWVDAVTPEITKTKDITADEFISGGSKTNFPCTAAQSYTRGSSSASGVDNTTYGCILPIDGANFDVANNSVVPYGSKYTQKLKDDTLDRLSYFPARNSSRLAIISNSYNFFYGGTPTLYLVDDWRSTYTNFSVDGYNNVSRQPSRPYDFVLKYANGEPVSVNSNGTSFSTNGEWLLIGVPGKSHISINMDTKTVVPFTHYIDSSYALHSAVSNDGKYIVVDKPYDSFRLYDTGRCQAQNGEMASKDCQSRDLLPLLKQYTNSNQIYIGDINFVGGGSALQFKAQWLDADGVSWRYALLKMRLPGIEVSKYLAMGDSFSSGEGAFDYVEATDQFVSNDEYNVCHVSRKSYPYLLQQNLQADWFYSVACSGSESKDVVYAKTLDDYVIRGNPRAKFQLQGEDDIEKSAFILQESSFYIDNMRPGYVPQYTFVSKNNPNVATISLGGNDVGFADIIASCIFKGVNINQTCFSERDEREAKANEIDQKISVWSKNFVDIKNSLGGSDPKLYVIGYPKIVDADLRNRCGLNVPFDDAERLLTDRLVDYLNAAVKVAADAAGVRYVDASDALTRTGEHRLCGSGPEFAVNGLDLRSYVNECTSAVAPGALACPNSFHPNELGQKLLAETILTRTTNLTQSMPDNSNSTANIIDKRMDFVGDVSITLQNHRITFWKDIAPELIAKGETFRINIPKSDNDLPAQQGSSATVTAHSIPLTLGQLPIAADGTITGDVVLPADIETGYHRLIVSYTDIAGNIVEKYRYFFAAHSTTDWDGDGIDNASDPCSIAIQSNMDIDRDGVDDVCDGEYVKAAHTSAPDTGQDGTIGTDLDLTSLSAEISQTKTDGELHGGYSSTVKDNVTVADIFTSPTTITPLGAVRLPVSDNGATPTIDDDVTSPNILLPLSVIAGLLLIVLAPFLFRKRRV